MQHLTYDQNQFYLCGEPFRILSGALHYFRIPRALWEDRLTRLRAMGLNTVETYVAWNLHETEPGQFDFTGERDLGAFLDTAARLGLHALVRPGPFICAEWEFGGLPAWLLREPMELRAFDGRFLRHVDRYFDALAPILVPRLHENGGPILAVQVESEYGSYGADKRYLQHLAGGLRRRGVCGCLFTSDGPCDVMLAGGTLPGAVKTANFGSGAVERFAVLRRHQPDAPLMCCEFWDGWFDHWGDARHHVRGAADTAAELDAILSTGASVSLYMFCGGTNFGFWNGANEHEETGYLPTTTSYDYDAPLTENGDYTPKYHACRAVLERYSSAPAVALPPPPARRAYGAVRLGECAELLPQLAALSSPVESPYPLWMEDVGQSTGFLLYRTRIQGPTDPGSCLVLHEVRDRAMVFTNWIYRDTFYRRDTVPMRIPLELGPDESVQVDILVENMGRVNYGLHLSDSRKGLGAVMLDYQRVPDWEIYPLPLHSLEGLRYGTTDARENQPVFLRGTFQVQEPADTFLDTAGLGKGVAFLNGRNLGRYWRRGPQRTLYLPACLQKSGENVLELLELHRPAASVELLDHAILG